MPDSREFEIHSTDTLFDNGRFSIKRYDLTHSTVDGQTQRVVRDCFERGDSVGVIAYDVARDSIVWLRQFRVGLIGEQHPWSVEPIAGKVDAEDTDPREAALRECREECGCEPTGMLPCPSFYPSPGACSEYIYMFIGLIDSTRVLERGGVATEQEDIEVVVKSFHDSMQWLHQGIITSSLGVVGLLYLGNIREQLRRNHEGRNAANKG